MLKQGKNGTMAQWQNGSTLLNLNLNLNLNMAYLLLISLSLPHAFTY
jgi:hypothetical protein